MVSRRSLVGDRFAIDFEHAEMDLMDVEGVGFESAIFDGPVFDGSNFGGDDGSFVGLEDFLLLSVDGDVELNGAVGAAKFLGEVELALMVAGCWARLRNLTPSAEGGVDLGMRAGLWQRLRRWSGCWSRCWPELCGSQDFPSGRC